MAINDLVGFIIILLYLIFRSDAYPEYQLRSTPRTRPAGHHVGNIDTRNINNKHFQNLNGSFTRHSAISLRSSPENNNKDGKGYDDEIVYPDNLKPACIQGLCYNTKGYPKDKIKRLLNRSQFNEEYFKIEETTDVDIGNRFNSDEMTLCETMVHTVYPEKANNTMQVERIIVNVDEFKQGVAFETCINEGKCKFSNFFPPEYTSYCKQKYVHKKLMVLGEEGDKAIFDTFKIPSCCVCTVKRTG